MEMIVVYVCLIVCAKWKCMNKKKEEKKYNSQKLIEHDKFVWFLVSFVACCNYQFAIVCLLYKTSSSVAIQYYMVLLFWMFHFGVGRNLVSVSPLVFCHGTILCVFVFFLLFFYFGGFCSMHWFSNWIMA